MGEGNSWHRSLNSLCVAAQYREESVWKRQIVSAAYLNIPLTSLIWERETPNIPSRSRNKVGSSLYQQVFIWRKTPLTVLLCWTWKEKNRRKKASFQWFWGFSVFWFVFFQHIPLPFPFPSTPPPLGSRMQQLDHVAIICFCISLIWVAGIGAGSHF